MAGVIRVLLSHYVVGRWRKAQDYGVVGTLSEEVETLCLDGRQAYSGLIGQDS